MKQVILQPVPLHRLFIHQKIESIEIERDSALLRCKQGDVRVDLSSSTLSSSANWLKLRKLTLTTPHETFDLAGLPESAVASANAAIQEAQRRKGVLFCLFERANQISEALVYWEELRARNAYLTFSDTSRWRQEVPSFSFPEGDDADLFGRLPLAQQQSVRQLMVLMKAPQEAADQRNNRYAAAELTAFKTFFDTVESNPLTDQQRQAIVHDEDNALIIAGAGTGKTSTIVGKVGYILSKGWAAPEEILLLAFTKKAAEEMQERIEKKLGVNVQVRTFHALGLEIVAKAQGKKPSLCPEAEDAKAKAQAVTRLITQQLADEDFRRDLLTFQSSLRRAFKPAWEFKSETDYTQYLLLVEPRALTGRLLKSYEECEIANWLTVNGVHFEYERAYEISTATIDYRQYKPDFYLTDYGVYIEHWGVDRNNNTAPFVPNEKYLEGMRWKRELHESNETKLVETYSWEQQEGVLLTNLAAKLQELGVEHQPISMEATIALLNEQGRIDPLVTLLGTFLSLFKSSGYKMIDLHGRTNRSGDPGRGERFLRLFEKLFTEYETLIHGRGEIDFDDMITQAREHVENGSYQSKFRYILVDEFQDISLGRAKLILALRNQVQGAKLFCVGDDWQSIYRFTGSDISLTTAFEEKFGFTRKTALNRTFRFHDKIAGFSSRFVQQNPSQLRKGLTTSLASDQPGVVVWMRDGSQDTLGDSLSQIAADAKASDAKASVFLLGRYKFSAPDNLKALQSRFSDLSIQFMTAHSCKGLEADYVIIDGLTSGKYGFPSEIADDPVLGMVLADGEQFEFAEERRLFYVALTRAKKRVHLVADATNPSAFVREVLTDGDYEKEVAGVVSANSDVCPACERGKITKREGDFGVFFSCSNQPICGYKEQPCSRCKRGRIRQSAEKEMICDTCGLKGQTCPQCKVGVLIIKHGKNSGRAFWGCSTFSQSSGSCDYKEWIRS